MNIDLIVKTRVLLIQVGKVIPFVFCFVVLISFCESLYALLTNDFIEFSDGVYLNKPLSWYIGQYFKYDFVTLIVLTIISFAIRTCIYNKLAILYLALNFFEKSFFATHEYMDYVYYFVIATNILIATFFVYKGLMILISKQHGTI